MSDYADIEDELATFITRELGYVAGSIVDVTTEAKAKAGVVRVTHFGGPRSALNDYARVEIESFAGTRAKARQMLEDVHDTLLPRARLVSAIIDDVRTDASPHRAPWDNNNVRRFSATYQITVRTQKGTHL